jgi:Mrp family chromosome partitioning ATPase
MDEPHPVARAFEAPVRDGPAEDAPFIEVGGPRSELDASPDVVAASRRAEEPLSAGPAHARLYVVPAPAEPGPGLVQVGFRPLPAAPNVLPPACDRFGRELIAFHQPDHPVSEQHRTLLAGIESQLPAGQPHVLLFTAPRPGAGTTTVLLNLAVTLAQRGRVRVAVVDANLERPALAERLGLPRGPGLREILAGGVAPLRSLQETGLEGLSAVAAGQAREPNRAALAGEVMRSLLRYLRGRFDWVLVDGPCWDGSRHLGTLAGHCDAVYVVLPETLAQAVEVTELQNAIGQHGGRLRGCIFTQRPVAA